MIRSWWNRSRDHRTVPNAAFAAAGLAAVALSFAALSSLAEESGFSGRTAWLLPVAVDALAVAAWWSHRHRDRAAGWVALMVTVISMAGNALAHLIEMDYLQINRYLVAACAITPPAATATCVWLQRRRGKHVARDVEDIWAEVADEVVDRVSARVADVASERAAEQVEAAVAKVYDLAEHRLAREVEPPDATVLDAAAEPVADEVAPPVAETADVAPEPVAETPKYAPLPLPRPAEPVAETRDARIARIVAVARRAGVAGERTIRREAKCSWDDAKEAARLLRNERERSRDLAELAEIEREEVNA